MTKEIINATIFTMDSYDVPSFDYAWVERWLKRWNGQVVVVDYSSGGWEHIWDVSGPREAIAEIPERFLCASKWADNINPHS
ncbi:hypothetical protein [Azospirillum palustre]|uniref:hypothetical protein n=1 Tax=Azospirillum palustre TaxID=2044885 RepID=UPI00137B1168|nr:hypothetical protein [Azospirillum palustre]